MKLLALATLVAVASLNLTAPAQAVILGGSVTSGPDGAVFQELHPFAVFSVGSDNFDSPNLYGFNEDQNILLTTTLAVNVGRNVAEGQTVASHYIFFDPRRSARIQGTVTFDAEIIGIATNRANLNASDILQNNAVTYLSPNARGLEVQDSVSFDGSTLTLDFRASSPGDYIRVFTQESPTASIPAP